MMEWPLIFLAGFLGSSHCVGMCGGFALSIGMGATSWRNNLGRQLIYSLGRIFTYTFAGAVVGFLGVRLNHADSGLVNVQAILSIVAGVLLVVQGFHSAGWLPVWRKSHAQSETCLARSFFGSFLTAPGLWNVFIAGLLTGFLPCGLVYAFLALAASLGTMSGGMALMAVFGAGTIPIMVLTGAGATALSVAARTRLLKIAAVCVILTGVSAVYRGTGYWDQPATDHCPVCDSPTAALPMTLPTP